MAQEMNLWEINEADEKIIELALQEDLGIVFTDITTQLLLKNNDRPSRGRIISKHHEPIVLCGLALIKAVLDEFQVKYTLSTPFKDGDLIPSGHTIVEIETDGQTLLMAERTLLNFLRHLSAIATLTRKFVNLVQHTELKILDTRKTTPGWRHLEKYAVTCGGGVNHRLGLYDAIMVKDTHIDVLGGMTQAIAALPDKNEHGMPVIVEVRSLDELAIVIAQGKNKVDRVLLDNMSPDLMRECVVLCDGLFLTEASGNLNLETIRAVAETGVNFASIGMITHSAGNVDLSLSTYFAEN